MTGAAGPGTESASRRFSAQLRRARRRSHVAPVSPNFDRIGRLFKTKQGLEIRFHDLQHTHATRLLKAGIHPKVVSERLGHASLSIALDMYSQVMPACRRRPLSGSTPACEQHWQADDRIIRTLRR